MTDLWNDDEPEPVVVELGEWALELRHGGSLSNITFAGVPVLRAVRGVLRDRDWRTAPATVLEVVGGDRELRVSGEFHDDGGEDVVDASWRLDVRSDTEELVVEFAAVTRTAFQRNRFGLVVLHRPDDAGLAVTVTHPDGSTAGTRFPVAIAPHQPARAIAGLAWRRPGVDVALEFDGDVFEMEDQRNWTDASFKTYSTPLERPFPVELPSAAVVRQRVALRCARNSEPLPEAARPGRIDLVATGEPLPQWGTTTPVAGVAATLLVELVVADPGWRTVLAAALAAGVPLDVRIVTDAPAEIPAVLDALTATRVLRVGVHSVRRHVSTPALWTALRTETSRRAGAWELVAGARSHFTELNRTLEELPADADGVVFSSTPQMHDTGRDQVLEALTIQRLTALQAVSIAGGRPVHVGPVTLRARFNAVATTPWRLDRDHLVPDPRAQGRAVAAWVLASAAAFSVPGVASVTFGDIEGPGGDTVRLLAALAGWERLEPVGVLPVGVHVLAGRRDGRTVVLLANVAGERRSVDLQGSEVDLEPGEVVERRL